MILMIVLSFLTILTSGDDVTNCPGRGSNEAESSREGWYSEKESCPDKKDKSASGQSKNKLEEHEFSSVIMKDSKGSDQLPDNNKHDNNNNNNNNNNSSKNSSNVKTKTSSNSNSSNLNNSNYNIDVILQKISTDKSTPEWASILISCIRGLLGEVKGRSDVARRVDELESRRVEQTKAIVELKRDVESLRVTVERTNGFVDRLEKTELAVENTEQENRKNCLLIHGVTEQPSEKTADNVLGIIKKDLGVSLEHSALKEVYRIGKYDEPHRRNEKVRPILLQFTSHQAKKLVFGAKRRLKGSRVMITEHLTKKRQEILKAAIMKMGRGNVWTNDGKVMTKIKDEYVVLESIESVNALTV